MKEILLDENVDNRVKQFLESRGFTVKTTESEDLTSEPDKKIIAYCEEEGLAVLTHDDDLVSIKERDSRKVTVVLIPQRIRFREMKNRLEKLDLDKPKSHTVFL